NKGTYYGSISSPGNDPLACTVGAVKTMGTVDRGDDLVCNFSSRGPSVGDFVLKPDCVAPGNRIVSLNSPGSTLCRSNPANQVFPNSVVGSALAAASSAPYFELSGTS